MTIKFLQICKTAVSIWGGALITTWYLKQKGTRYAMNNAALPNSKLKRRPIRNEQIQSLQKGDEYDVLIIGGGATGVGCALDAVTRGLKTALVESDDFASGTSSRSSKLIYGGMRFLQKAIMDLDYDQLKLVKEALDERAFMLESAPHLTQQIPIMVPVYTWWKLPFIWLGIKCYDFAAGDRNVKSSYYLSKKETLELFPMLKKEKLCGGIVYYDGQQDDARMCLAVALTAARHGATVCNHVEVKNLLKMKDADGNEILCGAMVKDHICGKEFEVKAKCIINATGPFTDSIRKMDDKHVKPICSPSCGVHIVLPGCFSPDHMGLLDPATSDCRVIFFLPWQRQTIVGTTESTCRVTHNPKPSEAEIQFILNEIRNYLNDDLKVRRGDVLSAWSGIRPLVSDPNTEDTQSLARNHIVHVSPSKLVTIAGGKWTTYRAMAEHTIDAAIKACNLKPETEKAVTSKIKIEGGEGWTPTMYIRLLQDYGLECGVAQHLAKSYGDQAFSVARLATSTGKRWPIIGNKIHPEFPYIEAEIRYGVREYACNAIDMIARRLRLSFLNAQAANEALPVIVDIMAEELEWSDDEREEQIKLATKFLSNEMGLNVNKASRGRAATNLSPEEQRMYVIRFKLIDKDKKGYVSINDISQALKGDGDVYISGEQLYKIFREIDTNMNGQVELDEYLQLMSAIKTSRVANKSTKPIYGTAMAGGET